MAPNFRRHVRPLLHSPDPQLSYGIGFMGVGCIVSESISAQNQQVTPKKLMSPTCLACLEWGAPIHGRRQNNFQEGARNPSFVGFNGQNRNILHVLMVKIIKLCEPGGAPAPSYPLYRRLSTPGRPCARTVAKNKKYQDVDHDEKRTQAPRLRAERAIHYTTRPWVK